MTEAITGGTVDELFGGAPQIYVGVDSGGAPHVTPELVATGDGRLWCLTAAVTHKASVLADDERIAFYASTERGHALGIGRASVFNPVKPADLTSPIDVARSAVAAARFVTRNAAELTGAALDALVGRLGSPLPPHRVVVGIEPTALALLDDDGVSIWGEWGDGSPVSSPAPSEPSDLDDSVAPEHLRELLEDGPAALGWLTATGHPLVLPATWTRTGSSARVDAALFRHCGAAASSPAAVTRDKWTGLGPTGKQGVMLRGPATATVAATESTVVVNVERVTYWDGVETHTAKTA